MPKHLVTHDGTFHADDVFAAARLLQFYPLARLIRTRDKVIIDDPDNVVFDVGHRYAPNENRFDHHQASAPARDDGTPYSAFGLIGKHFGHQFVRRFSKDEPSIDLPIDFVWNIIDRTIVRHIDERDNRIGPASHPGCRRAA